MTAGWLRRGLATGLVVTLLVGALAQPADAADDIAVPFTEKLLTTIPDDASVTPVQLQFKYLHDVDTWGWPFACRDGQNVAFMASAIDEDENERGYVFANGKTEHLYESVRYLVLSDDGQHYAYGAQVGSQWAAVIDGERGELYKNVIGLCFSPDGKRAAYRARQDDDQWVIVLDGDTVGPHAGVGPISFSPNSKRVAYSWNTGASMWRVSVDSVSGAEYDAIGGALIFSDDSRHFAYVGIESGRSQVVSSTLRSRTYNDVPTLSFLRDGRLAYTAKRGRRIIPVLDRQALPRSRWASAPYLPRKGRHVLFAASDGKKMQIKAVTKKEPKLVEEHDHHGESVELFAWAGKGKKFAYIARDGERDEVVERVVIEGAPGPEFGRVIRQLRFSPKKDHLVYFAQDADGKRHIVINDQVSEPYDDVYPVAHFDKSEKKVAFCARSGQEIWWRVLDVK